MSLDMFGLRNGAPTRTRTADLLITNQLLYQLSYRGTGDATFAIFTDFMQVLFRSFSQENFSHFKTSKNPILSTRKGPSGRPLGLY